MTKAQAGRALAILNAGFPRDAVEPETAAVWVDEIGRLADAEAAEEAARTCIRGGDRFPSLREFRTTYRAAHDRRIAGRQIEEPQEDKIPPPPELRAMMARGVLKDIPESASIVLRPVAQRLADRRAGRQLFAPTEAEKHDAIEVMRVWCDDELYAEAERIFAVAAVAHEPVYRDDGRTVVPFLPRWAEEFGISEPVEGEPFRDYWTRIGFPPAVVDEAMTYDDPRKLACANQRMLAHLRNRHPAAFDEFALAARGR